MKSVVFESHKKVELQERPEPQPRDGRETLIKILACGLCGSDLRLMTDPPGMSCEPNTIIGHEIVGVVEAPAAHSAFQVGDIVVVQPNYACRECFNCKRGLINLCDNFDHAGAVTNGGLAEWLWVPNEYLHLVPEGLDPHVAALAEPLGCILNGAVRAGWKPNEPAVVLGAGPIGLLFLAYAKLSGAAPIIMTEPNATRAAVALDMGADHVVDPTSNGAIEAINELVGGHGARVVIDTMGTLLETGLQVVAKGGEIFVFGVNHSAKITITPAAIVDKEISIHGIYIARGTFPLALNLLAAHRDLFAKIVSDKVPLEDWESARKLLISGESAGKILVTMASE